LSQATFYEFPGTGHGVSVSGDCALELVESFLADPSSEPDASCLAELGTLAFDVPGGSEETITLVPFENNIFGFTGVVPEGWEEVTFGVYSRGSSALDQTALIQQAAPGLGEEQLLGLLASQMGWEEEPESSGTYETTTLTWTLYETEVQGFPAIMGLAEEGGTLFLVMLISSAEEQEMLINEVFFPVLEALTIQ
jgi:hypothetical protein